MTAFDDLADAIQTARSSVFRLEGHQDYPGDELWQAHQRGEWWEQRDELAWWVGLVSANVDRGVTMTRVRVVTEPWTDYTKWEIGAHYPHNIVAGEQVRLWRRAVGLPARPDYHLIDDARAWFLTYGPSGAMTVTEATPRALPTLRAWRDDALARAEPPLRLTAS